LFPFFISDEWGEIERNDCGEGPYDQREKMGTELNDGKDLQASH
jgi:hypothetical protein